MKIPPDKEVVTREFPLERWPNAALRFPWMKFQVGYYRDHLNLYAYDGRPSSGYYSSRDTVSVFALCGYGETLAKAQKMAGIKAT